MRPHSPVLASPMLRAALILLLALPVALVVSLAPSRHGPSEADIAVLASDAHVLVGGVPLVLPFVALPDQVSMGQTFALDRQEALGEWRAQRDAFRAAASGSGGALTLDRVGLRIDTWGWGNDENVSKWRTLCPQLTRSWSRSICDDPWAPLRQALPRNFHLADDRRLEAFDGHFTVGMEPMGDQLRTMTLRPGEVSVVCDRELSERGRQCSAARPIQGHLVAVWLVADDEAEAAEEQAERQGEIIAAFVTLALGPEENFPALVDAACDARRPGSGPSGVGRGAPYPCANQG